MTPLSSGVSPEPFWRSRQFWGGGQRAGYHPQTLAPHRSPWHREGGTPVHWGHSCATPPSHPNSWGAPSPMLHHDPHGGGGEVRWGGVGVPHPRCTGTPSRLGASFPRGGGKVPAPVPFPSRPPPPLPSPLRSSVGALPCPARPPVSHAPAVRLPGRRAGAEGSRKRRGGVGGSGREGV